MANQIDALLGMGITPESNMQALADNLRGQQRAGQFLGLSQIDPAQNLGKSLQRQAVGTAQSAGQRQAQMQREQQTQANADRRFNFEKAEAERKQKQLEATMAGHKEAWKKEGMVPTQLAKNYLGQWVDANTGAQINPQDYTFTKPNEGGDTRLKPTGKVAGNYITFSNAAGKLERLIKQSEGWDEKTKEFASRPMSEIGLDVAGNVLPDSAIRAIEEQMYEGNDEVKSWRLALAKYESDIRRAMSGLAVTKYEGQSTEKWSPYAPGITIGERIRRMKVILKDMKEDMKANRIVYKGLPTLYEENQGNAAPKTYAVPQGWSIKPKGATTQPTATAQPAQPAQTQLPESLKQYEINQPNLFMSPQKAQTNQQLNQAISMFGSGAGGM